MKLRQLFLLGFLLTTFSLQAQFTPGYLITQEGDTLDGLTMYAGYNSVYYKQHKKGIRKIYKAKDLKEFTIKGEDFQTSIVEVLMGHFPEKVFGVLKVKVKGPVKLLEFQGKDRYGGKHLNYFVQEGQKTLVRVPKKPKAFKRDMSTYFREFSGLAEQIQAGTYGLDELEQIVQMFNEWWAKE